MFVRGYPAFVVASAAFVSAFVVGAAVWLALQAPYIGLSLAPDLARDKVLIQSVDPNGPSLQLHGAASLEAVNGIEIRASDLIEAPDSFDSYSDFNSFMERQAILAEAIKSGKVQLAVRDHGGEIRQVEVLPAPRKLLDLPSTFWVPLGTGAFVLLISVWLLVLRPSDPSATFFALAGISATLTMSGVSIYTSRELALDEGMFRALFKGAQLTSISADSFAAGVFLLHPRRLIAPSRVWLLPAISTAWFILDGLQVFAGPGSTYHILTFTYVAVIPAAIAAQWFASRGHPIERAAFICFGSGMLIGVGLFCGIYAMPLLMGKAPVFSRAYSFTVALPAYIGIALGISRYRLFELGEWAFPIMFYAAGVLLLLVFDAGLIFVLQLEHGLSFGLSLIAIGFAYLPLREFLWRRLVTRPQMSDEELFQRILEIVLSITPGERAEKWRILMVRLFNPLEIRVVEENAPEAAIRADGIEMILPQTAVSPSLLLRYPWTGRRLFNSSHLRVAAQAMALVEQAETSRQAYERGASDERYRIARDLHDDVGARLLSSLHKSDLPGTRETIRLAMDELRMVISELIGEHRILGEVLSDLRYETIERIEAAGLTITWTPLDDRTPLSYATYKNLVSAVREVVSNVLRHAEATRVDVLVERIGDKLQMLIMDDGIGISRAAQSSSTSGLGLRSVTKRVTDTGGEILLEAPEVGTRVTLIFPLTSLQR